MCQSDSKKFALPEVDQLAQICSKLSTSWRNKQNRYSPRPRNEGHSFLCANKIAHGSSVDDTVLLNCSRPAFVRGNSEPILWNPLSSMFWENRKAAMVARATTGGKKSMKRIKRNEKEKQRVQFRPQWQSESIGQTSPRSVTKLPTDTSVRNLCRWDSSAPCSFSKSNAPKPRRRLSNTDADAVLKCIQRSD